MEEEKLTEPGPEQDFAVHLQYPTQARPARRS
jgi:hypothetical protein